VSRRTLAWVVLGVWVATLGWLVQRQYFRSTGSRLAEAALAIPPGARYYRLSIGDSAIGFASTTIDTLADSIRVDDVLVQDVTTPGRLDRTTARSSAIVGRSLRLRSLTVAFDGDEGPFDARGDVLGDSVLRLAFVIAGDSDVARVRLDRSPVVPSLLALRLAFGGELQIGHRYALRLFDPITLGERDVALSVAAETTLVVSDSAAFDSVANVWVPVLWDSVPAFRLDADSGGQRLWIDAQGQVVRTEEPTGTVLERAAFELAYENFRHRDTAALVRRAAPGPGGIIAATALAAGTLPDGAARERFRVIVRNADPSRLLLGGGGQHVQGDTVDVRRADSAMLAAHYLLPARDTGLARWLRSEPLIQTNDPRIAAQARQIVGRERNPAKAAGRIVAWLGTLRRAHLAGVPSATRTLTTRSGDCTDLTALFVALARAAGIPARPAAGLLWQSPHFYYHAWAEVYLGDWVAVDPLLGQLPADAGRVRLRTGDLAGRGTLTRLIGNLKLETL
jgi:hypothetical protein